MVMSLSLMFNQGNFPHVQSGKELAGHTIHLL
jgi:hypothetical protein